MGLHLPKLSNLVKTVESDFKKAESVVAKDASKVGTALKNDALAVKDGFVNAGGAAIGYAEMVGLQYPVKPYQSQVSDQLTRGSRLDAAGIADLQSKGYKGIVNLCAENNNDAAAAKDVGMNSLHVPIIDNTPPSEAQMKTMLDFVTNPANEPAYIHCEAGQGRTGVSVACYRMAVQGWTAQAALAEAKQFGMKMPDQQAFITQFGADLSAGKIAGYPK